jgi:hypothetical protein
MANLQLPAENVEEEEAVGGDFTTDCTARGGIVSGNTCDLSGQVILDI